MKPKPSIADRTLDTLVGKSRIQAIEEAIQLLLEPLSGHDQESLLRRLLASRCPIDTPRAGEVLGAIVRLMPRRSQWTAAEVKDEVAAQGISATPKEVYNAISYLTRTGRIRRIGYGRYQLDGVGIVTSDELLNNRAVEG